MSDSEADIHCETPVFWVGAAGFNPQQRAFIETCLHQATGSTTWRLCSIGDADTWLVNGEMCRLLPNGSLRVLSGSLGEASLKLDIGATGRPVAFAVPIVEAAVEPQLTFDVNSAASLKGLLAEFDSCLRFARAQFTLGAEVVRRGAALRHGVFHVSKGDKLLAILDFWRGEAGLAANLDAVEFEDAQWLKQPKTVAGALPSGFVRSRRRSSLGTTRGAVSAICCHHDTETERSTIAARRGCLCRGCATPT